MSATLFWLQGGGCGGDTMSLLNAESPDLMEALRLVDLQVLWHPSLSISSPESFRRLVDRLINGQDCLDVLVVEGAVIRGPGGTGRFDVFAGEPKKDLVSSLARIARYVVAVGTCASFGGIGSESEVEATGLQYSGWKLGGFLGPQFRSREDVPVINLPGCPAHCAPVLSTLAALALGQEVELDEFQRPCNWYGILVHQGCTRNEYHEYRVEEVAFGQKGCLFFHKGCHGPLVYGPCNKTLWNRRSSKTRVGVPCFGCTRPDFPQSNPFFVTENIEGIPVNLPDGVRRAHYMAYKGMAAAAAPDRLKERKTKV